MTKEAKVAEAVELANRLIELVKQLESEMIFAEFNPQSVYGLEAAMYDLRCDEDCE